ncbi:hypothetical protein [Xanthomonas fragariae]|uniref:hypothetical protein n=1 Tax=Xanthomonas fragariae TaxID=48664 RepID=UPI0022AA92AF|nr:hypothetical protein [Xanthomonas fragariae]WAT14686.1 hypothetical protein OZ429_17290 [Xanthomonas fragariae]
MSQALALAYEKQRQRFAATELGLAGDVAATQRDLRGMAMGSQGRLPSSGLKTQIKTSVVEAALSHFDTTHVDAINTFRSALSASESSTHATARRIQSAAPIAFRSHRPHA